MHHFLRSNSGWLVFLALVLTLVLLPTTSSIAQEKKAEGQFGTTKADPAPKTGDPGPLRQNICRDPKLCDSIDIDLLNALQEKKVTVALPEAGIGKGSKDYQAALYLGMAVADGLGAVVRKDKALFTKYLSALQAYGKILAVSPLSMTKLQQLGQLTEKGQWDQAALALYEFKDAVVGELTRKNQKPLADLAMLGGGVEGLYLLAGSLDAAYAAETAKLMRNKSLSAFLKTYLGGLPPEISGLPEVKAIAQALPELEKALGKAPDETYTQEEVKAVAKLTTSLRKGILD
jgi:hypothetical protein